MKHMIMSVTVSLVLCCALLPILSTASKKTSTPPQGDKRATPVETMLGSSLTVDAEHGPDAKAQQEEEQGVKVLSSQVLETGQALTRFSEIDRSDLEVPVASQALVKQGYKPQTNPENFF